MDSNPSHPPGMRPGCSVSLFHRRAGWGTKMVQRGGGGAQARAQVGWLVACALTAGRHITPCPVTAPWGLQLIWASLFPSPLPPQPTIMGQMVRGFCKLVH